MVISIIMHQRININHGVRFEVLTAVQLKIQFIGAVLQCCWASGFQNSDEILQNPVKCWECKILHYTRFIKNY